jgi:serine protease Do
MMNCLERLQFRDLRQALLVAGSAGAISFLGLAGFAAAPDGSIHLAGANVPPPHPAEPHMAVHNSPPRMLENGAPFSFADLVERVSPAVVTVTVEQQMKPQQNFNPEELPEPFRDFFNQFGGEGGGRQDSSSTDPAISSPTIMSSPTARRSR